MKECAICGKSFNSNHTRRIYCSAECAKNAQTEKIHKWNHDNNHYVKRTVLCRICGDPVEAEICALGISRPKMHYECIVNDIITTISSGKTLSKVQQSRKNRLGLTNQELREIIQCRSES